MNGSKLKQVFFILATSFVVTTSCSSEDWFEENNNEWNGSGNSATTGELATFDIAIDKTTVEPTATANAYYPDDEDALDDNDFTTEVAIDLSDPMTKTENGVEVTANGSHVTADHVYIFDTRKTKSFWERGVFEENFSQTQGLSRHGALWHTSSEIGANGFGLFNIQAGHEPVELLPGKIPGLLAISRPVVSSVYTEALVNENETRSVIHERLDAILSSSAEQKQGIRFWILADNLFNDRAQSVD